MHRNEEKKQKQIVDRGTRRKEEFQHLSKDCSSELSGRSGRAVIGGRNPRSSPRHIPQQGQCRTGKAEVRSPG